ncbi:hypothetical protein LWI28_021049 [Acer negundo]|uniref:Uncharacterized protein n=1 Tax=Acer negundo TaxID=4023 RepID=A0AAD5P3R9_ACENE|nr:hypothetical protein LWI28_021049 [Acer negundo]KAK4850568.1 hypothetical protein QYF36_007887 [Acer negundo]
MEKSGIRKMIEDVQKNYEKIFLEIEKASNRLEAAEKELNEREKQLQQRETQFEAERNRFNKRKRKNEKEELDTKKFELEKKIRARTLLELEIHSLRFDIEEMEPKENSEQEAVDGECEIFEYPKNKCRELHNTVTGTLNEMDEYSTPNEHNANTTPDMATDTLSSSWPRWDSVDTMCPGTASSWGNKSL